MRFKLILATIQTEQKEKPAKCLACGSRHIQHWQNLVRKIRDTKVERIEIDRWRCRVCQRTFQTTPAGISSYCIGHCHDQRTIQDDPLTRKSSDPTPIRYFAKRRAIKKKILKS